MTPLTPIAFHNNRLVLLDQRKLPDRLEYLQLDTVHQVHSSIRDMVVRGAPAIGIAAGYGMVLCTLGSGAVHGAALTAELEHAGAYLKTARPTAVNLSRAVDRILQAAKAAEPNGPGAIRDAVLVLAMSMEREEKQADRVIGEHLLFLFGEKRNILTHCNAGGLATGGVGTATAAFYLGLERGIGFRVYAGETRPRLQGSMLTAYELSRSGMDVTVLTDSTAAYLMERGEIDAVVVGCDRIAANGDTANKIGTYGLSILAFYHGIPFYVAAPTSSIDIETPDGKKIPIEERAEEEVSCTFGVRTVPKGVRILNYAFDVTPHSLITAIATEQGILYPPYGEGLRKIVSR